MILEWGQPRTRSKQGLARGVPRAKFQGVDPSRGRDGATEGDKHFRGADGVLPGKVLGDPVGDQGLANPSAEGFGGRPINT